QAAIVGEQPGIANRERNLEQRSGLTKPIRAHSAMGEVRAKLRRQISAGDHAQVDLVAEIGEDALRRSADTIAAGFVDPRSCADVLLDYPAQLDKLLLLQCKRQVAWIGVLISLRFNKGRVIPGLQMGPDLARARAMIIADNLIGLWRAADRIVQDIG